MRNLRIAPVIAVLIAVGALAVCGAVPANTSPALASETRVQLKPEVAELIKQSTDTYKKMKSYRHTAKWSLIIPADGGEAHEDANFTLALERPNRFVYKMDSQSRVLPPVAAYCDGKTFINFKAKFNPTPVKQYIKVKAPESYAGINIVDDVEFRPIGTYIIALMLQGDALADKDVRLALEKATVKPTVMENGKKWHVLEMPFGTDETPITVYIGHDDHLIGKSVQKGDPKKGEPKITEQIEGIKIDNPIGPASFQYDLPADAKQVERFSAPQRPTDAMRRAKPGQSARNVS